MPESGLKPYTESDIQSTNLPDNLQEIGHEVQAIENTNVRTQLEITSETFTQLIETAKEPVNICVLGSNNLPSR